MFVKKKGTFVHYVTFNFTGEILCNCLIGGLDNKITSENEPVKLDNAFVIIEKGRKDRFYNDDILCIAEVNSSERPDPAILS